MDDATKRCSRCKQMLPLEEFWKNKTTKDGLATFCKACGRSQNRKWKRDHPEKVKEHAANWRKRNPDKMRKWNREQYLKDPVAYNAKQAEYTRQFRARNPEEHTRRRRNTMLKTNYGIDHDDYDELLAAQGGVCAICLGPPRGRNRTFLAVDHCHETGQVRGLLCDVCNVNLGKFDDDPARLRRAAEYLERWMLPSG